MSDVFKAYRQGYDARSEGRPREECPYMHGPEDGTMSGGHNIDVDHWREGWDAADARRGPVLDFDPNLINSGRMALTTVRLTLAQWEYRAVIEVNVRGNIGGLDVLEQAADQAWEGLDPHPSDPEIGMLTLTSLSGNTLTVADDEEEGVDWFRSLIVGFEIIGLASISTQRTTPYRQKKREGVREIPTVE